MRVEKAIEIIEQLAPPALAEPWDAIGLHVGSGRWPMRHAMLCIDVTEAVAAEAIEQKVDLLIAYHPVLFKPIARLTDADWKTRCLLDLVRKRVAVYCPHTALDAAPGGVNDFLAEAIGDGDLRPIKPVDPRGASCKVVVFTPTDHTDRIAAAMSEAGAGQIGDYSNCSFRLLGQGTFQGGEESNPFVGEAGQLEHVEEHRVEMVCPKAKLEPVLAALRQAHPYEEPAFDVYPLEPVASDPNAGQGRIVELDRPILLSTVASRIRNHLGLTKVKVARAPGAKKVQRIGLCAGAGGSLLEQAGDIDVFITGEMRYHDILAATHQGASIILAGHTETERPYLNVLQKRLKKMMDDSVKVTIAKADRPIMKLM